MDRRDVMSGSKGMLAAVAAALLAALVLAVWIGSRRQQHDVSALLERLRRAAAQEAPQASLESVDSLPAPVARYLRWCLPRGPVQSTRLVQIRQNGTLRTDPSRDRWMAFDADHLVAPAATGFVWNARVAIAPLFHIRVRDALLEGEGAGQVSVLSAFTVSSDSGTREMNAGSLHRFLAEAVWYPTALLPSPKLRWSPISADRALATLTDHGVSVSLEFRFARTGEVTGIYTPARWGTFGGSYEQRPWEGHFRYYERRDGVTVPTYGDVGWYVGDEWQAVWKGTITGYDSLRDDATGVN